MIESMLASNTAFKIYTILYASAPLGAVLAVGDGGAVLNEGSGIALGMAVGAMGTVGLGGYIIRGWVDKIDAAASQAKKMDDLIIKVEGLIANQCPSPGMCHELADRLERLEKK